MNYNDSPEVIFEAADAPAAIASGEWREPDSTNPAP
mgnify:CR=1 FL=1